MLQEKNNFPRKKNQSLTDPRGSEEHSLGNAALWYAPPYPHSRIDMKFHSIQRRLCSRLSKFIIIGFVEICHVIIAIGKLSQQETKSYVTRRINYYYQDVGPSRWPGKQGVSQHTSMKANFCSWLKETDRTIIAFGWFFKSSMDAFDLEVLWFD